MKSNDRFLSKEDSGMLLTILIQLNHFIGSEKGQVEASVKQLNEDVCDLVDKLLRGHFASDPKEWARLQEFLKRVHPVYDEIIARNYAELTREEE